MVDKDLQNAGQEDKDSVALTENENNESPNGDNTPEQPNEVTEITSTDDKSVTEDAGIINSSVETVKENHVPEPDSENIDVNNSDEQNDRSASSTLETVSPESDVTNTVEEDEKADESAEKEAVGNTDQKAEDKQIVETGAETTKDEESDDEDSDDEHDEEIDFSQYSKQQLADFLQELIDQENIPRARKHVDDIFSAFESILNEERQAALERFITEGGEEDAFQYSLTELDNRVEARYRLLKDRISAHYRDINKQREINYHKKLDLLDQMREIVDGEESDAGFKAFKDLQEEWKNTGQVPGQHNKTLWANYHALLDRFYDQRSIYYELKELDRKKNLEAKIQIVEKAEKLNEKEHLKEAIQELNDLHQEYKHIGPVPREDQEALWLRFKAASDVIYQKRKEYFAEQKSMLGENLEKKEALIEEIKEFASFNSTDPKEWNAKTKQVNALQKKWEGVGGLPRAKAKDINKQFWGNFKQYFSNKNKFFKSLESQREGNLKLKEELIKKAEDLKTSTDWNKTTQDMKRLQQEWKKVGPVPSKVRSETYAKFKAACDFFFDARREASGDIEKEYRENLKKKEEIIEKIKALKPEDSEQLHSLQNEFNDIGFVPRSAIKSVRHNFTEAINGYIKRSGIAGEEKARIKMESEMQEMLSGPNADRRIRQKEQGLRKQISKVEEEIALYKNNMEFFTGSSKAETFKNQFTEKIVKAEKQLKELKGELRVLRQMS